jgi:hypothetical protein
VAPYFEIENDFQGWATLNECYANLNGGVEFEVTAIDPSASTGKSLAKIFWKTPNPLVGPQ